MRMAAGIIAIGLSLIMLMQSCTITGLSGISEDTGMGEAGALGMGVAIMMFFGGAFVFGLPTVAMVIFLLAFVASLAGKEHFPDMEIWGYVCLVLAALAFFGRRKKHSPKEGGSEAE